MNSQEEFHFNFWQQYYLQLEAERFELTIKHFFEIGMISNVDYEFLSANLKMVKKYLKASLTQKQEDRSKQQDYWGSSYNYKQHFHQRYRRISYPIQASLFDIIKPIPITGEIIVSGLNERLEALKPKEIEKTGLKFPYKIPAGTQWNQVIIKFLDDESVEISVNKFKLTTDYKGVGMVGKGNLPGEQWTFLKVLAQCHGELTIKDSEAKDKYKKQKQVLSETLKNYFSIDYDPFYPYKSSSEKNENSYKIKITLIPVETVTKPNNVPDIEEDKFGIKEYLDEEAPQIVDQ